MNESTSYQLSAISSIDGRYRTIVASLAEHFSEYGLIRKRITVECEYLLALSEAGVIRALSKEETCRDFAQGYCRVDAFRSDVRRYKQCRLRYGAKRSSSIRNYPLNRGDSSIIDDSY